MYLIFPYTTLFRSGVRDIPVRVEHLHLVRAHENHAAVPAVLSLSFGRRRRTPLHVQLSVAERALCFDRPRARDDFHISVGDLDRKSTRLNSSHRCISSFPTRRSSDLGYVTFLYESSTCTSYVPMRITPLFPRSCPSPLGGVGARHSTCS